MLPFQVKERTKPFWKKDTLLLWLKVIVACIPGAVVTLLFDDYIEAHLHTPNVIAAALIVYGVAFILVENWNKTRRPRIRTLAAVDYRTAFLIGMFQVLSIIPHGGRFCNRAAGLAIFCQPRPAAFLSRLRHVRDKIRPDGHFVFKNCPVYGGCHGNIT